MRVRLKVNSIAGAPVTGGVEHVFDAAEGTIGRREDNDLVLSDDQKFVSKLHAKVLKGADGYRLMDTSANGVYLNDATQAVGYGNSVFINDGDRIFIGDYELLVQLLNDEAIDDAPSGASQHTAPFPAPAAAPQEADPFAAPAFDDPDHTARIPDDFPDPGFDGFASQTETPRPRNKASPFDALPPEQSETSSEFIPENWDETFIGLGTSGDKREETGSATQQTLGHNPAVNDFFRLPDVERAAGAESEEEQVPDRHAEQTAPVSSSPGVDADAIQAFIDGLGIDGSQLPALSPAFFRQLGALIRQNTFDMIQLLAARAAIKNEFRMEHTQFAGRNVNPLKFSVGLDDSIQQMLQAGDSPYLPLDEAFGEAFQDMKDHQLAVIRAMQEAIDSMVGKFDPDMLETAFAKEIGVAGRVPVARKAQQWDLFKRYYLDMADQGGASFRSLFGEAFVKTYDEQVQQLKRSRGQ